MTRVIRGAWSRRDLLLPVAVLAVVVTTGVVLVAALSGPAGLRLAHAAPLLVVGAVAFPVVVRDLLESRRDEVALARLRGQQPGRVLAGCLVEPGLALVAGALIGGVLGWLVADLAAAHLLVAASAETGPQVPEGVALVLVAGLVLTTATAASLLREPVARQVAGPRRAGRSTSLALFAQVLVPVAAVVAVYAARSGQQDGWLALAAPALVGLAVGLAAVWVVRGVAHLTTLRPDTALPVFLAVRRVARGGDVAATLCLVVAATVVAGGAGSALVAQREWTSDTAHLSMAAPVQHRVDLGAHQALALTEQLDPQGRWLMAAVVVSDQLAAQPQALVDTGRYRRVVDGYLGHTAAAGVGALVADLAPDEVGDVISTTGGRVSAALTVDRSSKRWPRNWFGRPWRPQVEFEYVTDQGYTSAVQVRPDLAGGRRSAELPECAGGCSLVRVTVSEIPWAESTLSQLRFGDVDLLEAGTMQVGDVVAEGGDLTLEHGPDTPAELAPVATPVPVLTTPDAPVQQVTAPGGERLEATTVDRVDALPLVQGHGVLGDLRRMLRGTAPSGNAVQVFVLARADTPADIRAAVEERTGTSAQTLAGTVRETEEATHADRGRVDVLGGLLCLAVAVPVLTVAGARGRRTARREAAALRSVGLPRRTLLGAVRRQFLLLAVPAAAAAVLGVLLVAGVVRPGRQLLDRPSGAIPVPGGTPWWLLLVTGAVMTALVLGWGRLTRTGRDNATRPVSLWREDQSGEGHR